MLETYRYVSLIVSNQYLLGGIGRPSCYLLQSLSIVLTFFLSSFLLQPKGDVKGVLESPQDIAPQAES